VEADGVGASNRHPLTDHSLTLGSTNSISLSQLEVVLVLVLVLVPIYGAHRVQWERLIWVHRLLGIIKPVLLVLGVNRHREVVLGLNILAGEEVFRLSVHRRPGLEEEDHHGINNLHLSSHNLLHPPHFEIDLMKDSIVRINFPSAPVVRSPFLTSFYDRSY
jgi:hypothetical protein